MKKRLVGAFLVFSICLTTAVPSLAYYDKDGDGHCDKCGSLAPVTAEVGCGCTENKGYKPWSNDPFISELLKGNQGKGELTYDLEHLGITPQLYKPPVDEIRLEEPEELAVAKDALR